MHEVCSQLDFDYEELLHHVVMGVQWLYLLGQVTIDWQNLEMKFTSLDGKLAVLRGITPTRLR